MSDLYKFPRTCHCEWSPGATNDDKVCYDLSEFHGQYCIVSEKRDGECSTLYPDYYHARSLDSKNHESRNWLKGLWGQIKHLIPDGWRICGENLYAEHSVAYDDLDTYFEVFAIFDENNTCLSRKDTEDWCELLGLKPVPVLWQGVFDLDVIRNLHETLDLDRQEGWVLRIAAAFPYADYGIYDENGNKQEKGRKVIKWVRENHVQTDEHWMSKRVVPNKLRNK